jgi:hypothetical protein
MTRTMKTRTKNSDLSPSQANLGSRIAIREGANLIASLPRTDAEVVGEAVVVAMPHNNA